MTTEIVNQTFVVGWGTLSLVISGIAKAFNRGGLLWWFLGLIGGPLTLFVLVIIGKDKKADF
jgi:hypothetical protein